MVGQLPEDLAVDRFRLGNPPALMQRHGIVKRACSHIPKLPPFGGKSIVRAGD